MNKRICLALVMFLASVVPARAADEKAPTAQPGPQAKEFQRVLGDWKAMLTELSQLQAKYRSAKAEDRPAIKERYAEVVKKGEALEPQLLQAAEKAYTEAPNADRQVSQFLTALLNERVEGDDYEKAVPLAQLLVKNHCPERQVTGLAGVAAFNVNDFETAEKQLQAAKAAGGLPERAEMLLSLIPYYKGIWAKEKEIRKAEAKADDLPRVLLKTSQGDIEVELFENEAPNTVANFISLVEKKFYNGITFHRVLGGFMAQAGCPKGDGTGGPGYFIPCECGQPNHRLHFRGTLSMAKQAAPDTGGSQFFLTFVPTKHLDGQHTVFGRVIEGFDVLAKLQRRDPEKPDPPKPDKIIEAKVLRKRPHAYEPKALPER